MASKPKYIAKIKIEHFPSRTELICLIDEYLFSIGHSKDYKTINQDSTILLIFKDSDTAFEVSKRLKVEQYSNALYSKLRVFLSLSNNYDTRLATINHPIIKKIASSVNKSIMLTVEGRNVNRQNQQKRDYSSLTLKTIPYVSLEDQLKLERKNNKSKWIGQRDFNPFVGYASTHKINYVPNFVGKTPSEPPVNYKFREIHKEKWVSNSTFK